MTHISVSKLGHHWFTWWLVAWPAPSHCLNQSWNSINWTHGNKFQWIFNQNTTIFIQQNAFENVVCKVSSILSRPQCVNGCKKQKIDYLQATTFQISDQIARRRTWKIQILQHSNFATYWYVTRQLIFKLNQWPIWLTKFLIKLSSLLLGHDTSCQGCGT